MECRCSIKQISGLTNDNSPNDEYCHYCFSQGEFTDPGITMEEKITKIIALAEKIGTPKQEASKLANATIPKLKRWN